MEERHEQEGVLRMRMQPNKDLDKPLIRKKIFGVRKCPICCVDENVCTGHNSIPCQNLITDKKIDGKWRK